MGRLAELGNGWRLALPEMTAQVRLPITIEARRMTGE
jgi:nitrogen fixation protein